MDQGNKPLQFFEDYINQEEIQPIKLIPAKLHIA